METLALQDDVIHLAAQLIRGSVERNACFRAGVTHAIEAISDGNTDLATTILIDLLEDHQ